MKVTVCGDVSPNRANELFIKKDAETLFRDVPQVFAGSDRVLVNLETALTEQETPIQKIGPNLKASPICAQVLKDVGVTDCSLCNNHIFDYGVPGVEDTIVAVEAAGLNWTGFGKNYRDSRKDLIMERDGMRVSFIAVCQREYCYALEDRMGARPFDCYDTIADIRKAKAECDYVVVIYHGGSEQCVYPSPRVRKMCQAMADNGADVVLCQHSHCIGCYEQYGGSHILYGQGNFHFVTKSNHPHWKSGLVVQLEFGDGVEIAFIPTEVHPDGIELAKGALKEEIMEGFQARSRDLQNGKWLEGWREFCEGKKEQYYGVIRTAYSQNATWDDNEMFSHYLYTEAHKDVWDEICKLSWETRKEV